MPRDVTSERSSTPVALPPLPAPKPSAVALRRLSLLDALPVDWRRLAGLLDGRPSAAARSFAADGLPNALFGAIARREEAREASDVHGDFLSLCDDDFTESPNKVTLFTVTRTHKTPKREGERESGGRGDVLCVCCVRGGAPTRS